MTQPRYSSTPVALGLAVVMALCAALPAGAVVCVTNGGGVALAAAHEPVSACGGDHSCHDEPANRAPVEDAASTFDAAGCDVCLDIDVPVERWRHDGPGVERDLAVGVAPVLAIETILPAAVPLTVCAANPPPPDHAALRSVVLRL